MIRHELIRAIGAQGGRATLGDLMAATARSAADIEQAILPALNEVGGHVAVDEHGELIYSVTGKRRRVPRGPWLSRLGRAAYRTFRVLFFAGLSFVLVAYFAFYILLAIALIVLAIAGASGGGDCDCSCDGCDGCSGCDGCDGCAACGDCCSCCGDSCSGCSTNRCGDQLAACVTCGATRKTARKLARERHREEVRNRREQRRTRRELRRVARWERRHHALQRLRHRLHMTDEPAYLGLALEREQLHDKPKFFRAVRDFIFGPPRPPEDPLARERNLLAFIKDHDGRVTAADAVTLTGLRLDQADAVLLDLAVRFEGDVTVTDGGTIVYTFDRLLVSASEDRELLEWVRARPDGVTVEEFARHTETSAKDALARLGHLARLVGGEAVHGEATRFVFPADASERMDELGERAATLRDWTYVWERLDLSPVVLGVPAGSRGWIVGLNLTNLVLSALLTMALGADAVPDLLAFLAAGGWMPWAVGYIPLVFSALVFLIPAVRAMVRSIGDRARLRRNAHKVFLLTLFHALEERAAVTPGDLGEALFPSRAVPQRKHLARELDRAASRLEGSVDHEAGLSDAGEFTYIFPRVHQELTDVVHERLQVDLNALSLKQLVYDTEE